MRLGLCTEDVAVVLVVGAWGWSRLPLGTFDWGSSASVVCLFAAEVSVAFQLELE